MSLKIDHLTVRRGLRRLFRDVSFEMSEGCALQVAGANGSGKSTFLRVVAGLLPREAGGLSWAGAPVERVPRDQLHYLAANDALKNDLSVRETFSYWRLLGQPHDAGAPWTAFDVERFLDVPTRYLSAGQRRRVALTRLLLWRAPLWLLDEPTNSLDRAGSAQLEQVIAGHRARGGMVILVTHGDIALPERRVLDLGGKP